MILRALLIIAVAMVVTSCTSTSDDGVLLKDRPVSPQGKVRNDYDYLV